MKKVQIYRWEVAAAFVFNVVAIVVVTIYLTGSVQDNRRIIKQNHRSIIAIAKLAKDGKQVHDSICILKADFKRRIRESKAFLKKHPNGIDGISATDIRRSLDGTQSTLKSLSPTKCAQERK